jgi:hypothetical protein
MKMKQHYLVLGLMFFCLFAAQCASSQMSGETPVRAVFAVR